jgi:hypothetical protein
MKSDRSFKSPLAAKPVEGFVEGHAKHLCAVIFGVAVQGTEGTPPPLPPPGKLEDVGG